jgi:hypothetical protein
MRSKVAHGRKSITGANNVLPAYMGDPRRVVSEKLADVSFPVQVDTTFKTTNRIMKSTTSALSLSA